MVAVEKKGSVITETDLYFTKISWGSLNVQKVFENLFSKSVQTLNSLAFNGSQKSAK